jgi:hypothetical protein
MSPFDSGRDSSLPPVDESVRRNRRWGCACGCAAFVLLLLLGVLGLTYWLIRKQPTAAPELLVPPGAAGYGVIRLSTSDPGLTELNGFLTRLATQAAEVHGGKNQAQLASMGMKTINSFVGMLIQSDLIVGLLPVDNPTDSRFPLNHVSGFFTRNHFGTLIGRTLLAASQGPGSKPQDYSHGKVLISADTTSGVWPVAWRDNLLIVGSDSNLIKATLDRVASQQAATLDVELQNLLDQIQFASPPDGEDIAFAIHLRPGLLRSLVRYLGKSSNEKTLDADFEKALQSAGLGWDDALGLTVTADVQSADTTKFQIRLVMSRPEVAKKLLAAIQQAFAKPPHIAPLAGPVAGRVDIKQDIQAIGSVVTIILTVSNIKEWLRQEWHLPLPGAAATLSQTTSTVTQP